MIELAKHIEVLLLENDCVIVPGLGGFIAHNRPAVYIEEKHLFEPPVRTIGFNPQLTINDGLLVQSYMQAYDTDFPDATRKIEKTVNTLKEQIYQEGHVVLENIGTLYYNMNGVYEFEPASRSFFTPGLYGLGGFSMDRLADNLMTLPETAPVPEKKDGPILPVYNWLRTAVAVAAAVLLFFILSTPVENTYVDDANFASLGSISMFDAIRDQSVATTLLQKTDAAQTDNKKEKVRNNVNTLKPVKVRTETVMPKKEAKAAVKAEKKKEKVTAKEKKLSAKTSYIIVASLTNNADAQNALKKFHKEGYNEAEVVESSGRFRIALNRYSDETNAYRKVQELRKIEEFKNAWVFTTK